MKLWALLTPAFLSLSGAFSVFAGTPEEDRLNCMRYRMSFNVNARVPLEDYMQKNSRDLFSYRTGLDFAVPKPGTRAIDVGGGLGVAYAELAEKGVTAIVINAQDIRQSPQYLSFQNLVQKGLFIFIPGLAEEVLGAHENEAGLLTDYWGAFPYSATRPELLELYYNALEPGGIGRVMLMEDVIRDQVIFGNAKFSLEDYLKRTHPEIFDVKRSPDPDLHNAYVLRISKPPHMPTRLNLRLKVKELDPGRRSSHFAVPRLLYEAP